MKFIEIAALWTRVDEATGVKKLSGLAARDNPWLPAGTKVILQRNKFKEPGDKKPDFRLIACVDDGPIAVPVDTPPPAEPEMERGTDDLPF